MFQLIFESCLVMLLLFYYCMESLVLKFVPTKYRRKDVTGETVLVTGAGSGLGRLMSVRFAQLGCTLVLWDVDKNSIQKTAELVRKYGVRAFPYQCDLSKHEEVYKVAELVKQEVGDVNILVNNAGVVTGKKFLQCPDSMIQKTMEVNIHAHFWTVKSFLPAMIHKNHGHIVNIASSAGIIGVNGLADYCASKFAAVGFDESLRFELEAMGRDGVHTTVVCPFYINTGMFDGAKTRFPLIVPILEPEYAVQQIMDAILTNQAMLLMPKSLYFMIGMKGLLPVKVQSLLCKFLGATNSMDEFIGRTVTNEQKRQ